MRLQELKEDKDLSELPLDTVKDLEKNVREGAKDTEQDWANAMELANKAYEVVGVQRPTPSLQAAWKQYEGLIQTACAELSKHRGLDGKWRMTSVHNS